MKRSRKRKSVVNNSKRRRHKRSSRYYDYDSDRREIRWDKLLFGIGVIIFLIAAIVAFINDMQESKSKKTMEGLRNMQEIVFAPSSQNDTANDEASTRIISYERLFELNEDMIGWLNIPGTEIDYPVMQTMNDEEYYLKRNFYGENDKNGCLFMDTDSDIQKTSNNLIIHGHNMRSGAMFGTLKEYDSEQYCSEHSKILFTTQTETRVYEVVAVIYSKVYTVADKVFKYYNFFEADSQEEFDDFYNNIKAMSIYDTGVSAEYGDEFITLSTCSYHVKNGRLAVIAKRTQ